MFLKYINIKYIIYKFKEIYIYNLKLWCDKPRQHIKKQRHHLVTKVHIVKTVVFPIVMWELDHKEGWAQKNWCFQIMVLEKTLESPSDCKEIKPVNSKGNQPWIFTGMTDAEAESSILCPPDVKSWLIGKDPDVGNGQEEKWVTEDEKVGWHHWLNGHEFEQPRRDSEGQGSLACCIPLGLKELDMT